MGKWLWPINRKLGIASIIVIVVVYAAIIWIGRSDTLPKLQEMNIGAPQVTYVSVAQGEEWKPSVLDSDGFAKVVENKRFILLLDPKKSQIAVFDKQSGYLWRSNPAKDKLGKETVKGTLLENLQSPYILEYVLDNETNRRLTNSLDPKMAVSYMLMGNGIQAIYTYTEMKLSFVIQYVLTDHGMEAMIPSEGIKETGATRVFAINLLPFFGAVSGTDEQGYLFVPDGPGGLIHYDHKRPATGNSYVFPIYGNDPANSQDSDKKMQREQISYPVFGLKRGEQAFAAIVKEGKYTASIKALPSGTVSTYHSLSASFNYREEYNRKISGITEETVIAIRKERILQDRRVEYRLLSSDDADYVGMAYTYRNYLEESGMLVPKLQAKDRMPLQLSIIGGAMKPKFGGYSYQTTTSFEQTEQIVDDLMQHGVANIRVTYQGWQNSGNAETDQRFPITKEIGGYKGAKDFVKTMHEKGVQVLFEDFISWTNPKHSDFSIKFDGVRSIDTTILRGKSEQFIVNPIKAIRKEKETIDTFKEIGADGIHYIDGPGDLVFSDYNPDSSLSREDTAFYYQSLMDYTRKELGAVGVYRGNDYALEHVDFIVELPFESSYDFMIDETVPFYPLVIHGSVEYTATAGNLRNVYDEEFLKAIEYGAIPYFKLTYSPSRDLKGTDYDYIFSSEFAIWKDRIVDEYGKFNQLAAVYNQRMIDHKKVEDGVYITTYEDGTSVTVNYNTKQFDVTRGGVQ